MSRGLEGKGEGKGWEGTGRNEEGERREMGRGYMERGEDVSRGIGGGRGRDGKNKEASRREGGRGGEGKGKRKNKCKSRIPKEYETERKQSKENWERTQNIKAQTLALQNLIP